MEKPVPEKILSIIIPMYNSQPFIKKCLDSMVIDEADMRLLEILVVNDGSKDDSPRIVEEYVRRWPDTIHLLNKENGGHGSAVNMGVEQCTGRYFKVVDADDWLRTEGLKQILGILQEIDQMDAVISGYQIYDIRTGTSDLVLSKQKSRTVYLELPEVMKKWDRYKRLFSLHGLIYGTAFYRSAGRNLPERVSYDDAYFDVVYAGRASKLCAVEEPLYVYRVGDASQSVSDSSRERKIHQMEAVLLCICETAEDEQNLSEAGKCYWYKRTVSFLSDYFVTVFLRFEDKEAGRKTAREFFCKIKKVNGKLYRMSRKNYWLLKIMSFLHVRERLLQEFFRKREILFRRQRTG